MKVSVRSALVAGAVLCFTTGSAWVQAQPVRLELRIVPQIGTVTSPAGAGVTDLPLTTPSTPLVFVTPGVVQRYELQYRVLDLNTVEVDNVPAGLSATSISITVSGAGGAGGTLARAQLSRFEAQLASTTPPTSPDLSGLPTGTAAARAGMHVPFRGGFSDQNNNALASNGTIAASGITGILPLSISQNNQGNANNGFDNTAWFGLYSFNLTVGNVIGDYTITAEATADPGTGNRFGWFNDGVAVPVQSNSATTGVTYFHIGASPAACCFNDGSCSLQTPSDCVLLAGSLLGSSTSCIPNPCPPAGACCFLGGACSFLTSSACATQGGQLIGTAVACAPDPCPPVRLELRLVPQTGTVTTPPGSGVIDLSAPPNPLYQGTTQRFELQYRVLDLNTSEPVYVPAGLAGASVDITVNNAAAGTFARAQLSRFEAQLAGTDPPSSTDQSGLPIGTAAVRRGVHVPFRGSFADANDNSLPSNGTITGDGISRILLLSISQNNQGNADNGIDNSAWYGLYSFDYTADVGFSGDVVITATAMADYVTGNRFSWFSDGIAIPMTSANAIPASVTVSIRPFLGACCSTIGGCTNVSSSACSTQGGAYLGDSTVCSPNPCPAAFACCFPGNVCSLLTATACSAQSGVSLGSGSSCSPNICPPPYGCCLPGFVCLIASVSSDCVTAGGTPLPRSTCAPQICCPTPVVTQQPQGLLLIPPQPVSFAVSATHPGTLTYQWRRNGVNLTDNGRITGAATTTLSISSTVAADAGTYDALITSSCGVSVASNPAVLNLCVSPSITSPPSNLDLCSGEPAAFSAQVSGTSPFTYQWRKNGTAIAGETSAALTIVSTASSDAGNYDCVVTNPCGSATTQSATLAVNVAPTITTQPAAASACLGGPATLAIVASGGTRSLSYQWRKSGVDIAGATSAAYTIPTTQSSDAGSYDCRVTSSCGTTISDAASLTIKMPPVITTNPTASSQCPGLSVSFNVAATGLAPLSYQWRKGGNVLPDATSDTYVIAHVSPGDVGTYDCVVSNSCGTATSSGAVLTVLTPVSISANPASLTRCEGTAASFTVVAFGSPSPSFQWRRNGVSIPGATAATYTIPSVATADAGNYDCQISNICNGLTSAAATLQVQTLPAITGHPQPQSPCIGYSVVFSVTATGSAPLAYQWRFNGVPIGGATLPSYSIAAVAAGNAGTYDCVVTNPCTNVTSNGASLSLGDPPSISSQPVSQSVTANSNTSMSVQAGGAQPLLYQWRRNGTPMLPAVNIPDVNSPTLSFSPVSPADDGVYDCLITGRCGVVTSRTATLTVSCVGSGPTLDCNNNGVCDLIELAGGHDLTAPSPATNDRFAWAVAIDSTRVLVGARSRATTAGAGAGAAYTFIFGGLEWARELEFVAPDGAAGDDFGNQVAVEGQWIAVAARNATVSGVAQAGAVYVFRNVSGSWQFFQKLTEPTPTPDGEFGHGIDLSGDRLLVGSLHGNGIQPGSGAAYVYRFNGLNWSREATLVAPDGQTGDGFGISVAISDPYLVIGAPYDVEGGLSSGSAYIFFRGFSGWALQSKVLPRLPQAGSTFGELVAMSGDVAMVNCPRETVNGLSSAGAVYMFRRTDIRWTQQRRLVSVSPQVNELYGFYIAIDGDTAAIGGFNRTVNGIGGAGTADLFKRTGNFWVLANRLESPKPEPLGWFGYSLAASGGRMVAGAFRGSAAGVPEAGWARVFNLGMLDCNRNYLPDICEIASGTVLDSNGNNIPDPCELRLCRADFNDSGTVSVQDIFDFLNDYFSGNLTADFNNSGVLSVQDLFDFLGVYFTGCA